jgi:cation-transporting ATPase 13A3/4/5
LDFISLECDDSEAEDLVRCGMAVCHSLSKTSTGDIVGNHVDQASFSATGAVLDHKIGGTRTITFIDKKYTILKQYEFDNVRVTQSVIVEDEAGAKHIFVKGSQEAIHDLCLNSTLPKTFELHNPASAKTGVYKLAMGYKKYELEGKISDIKRDDVESSLTFTGLINFQNCKCFCSKN